VGRTDGLGVRLCQDMSRDRTLQAPVLAGNRRWTVKARKLLAALGFGPGLTIVLVALLGAQDGPTLAQEAESSAGAVAAAQVVTPAWRTERVDAPKTFKNMTDRSLVLDSAGHPHIAYGQDHLYYAWYDGSAWQRQTVDAAWGVGGHASIQLDGDGNPHISYYDATSGDLKWAHWTGSAWAIVTVDSGGDVGQYTSVALDDGDNPHISYYDETNRELKHAWYNGSTWLSETVDTLPGVGEYSSLALEPTAPYTLHIAYYDDVGDDLKHAWLDGSTWLSETVDAGGDVGKYASLALDGDGYPRISYLDDGGNDDLKYARWTGSQWVSVTVDTGWVCGHTSLRLEPTGAYTPHITYYGGSYEVLSVYWTGIGWMSSIVDDYLGVYGGHTSLVLEPTAPYTAHVSYFDETTGDLKYARWSGSAWQPETVRQVRPLDRQRLGQRDRRQLRSDGPVHLARAGAHRSLHPTSQLPRIQLPEVRPLDRRWLGERNRGQHRLRGLVHVDRFGSG
jgi:hypothetical protein